MKNIAIIMARGGSKRIPRKNIKDFMGKPMISYVIVAALESKLFSEVMVSTEDEEIAEVAIKYGALVPFIRSRETADDFSGTDDVLFEVLSNYKKLDVSFDQFCCIYPCSPFLTSETLQEAYSLFQGEDTLVPVCKYSTPIERCFEIQDEKLKIWDTEAFKKRSQDLLPKYYDVGMFYFGKTELFMQTKNLVQNAKPYIIDENKCHDIDTFEDWKMAEMKYQILQRKAFL